MVSFPKFPALTFHMSLFRSRSKSQFIDLLKDGNSNKAGIYDLCNLSCTALLVKSIYSQDENVSYVRTV